MRLIQSHTNFFFFIACLCVNAFSYDWLPHIRHRQPSWGVVHESKFLHPETREKLFLTLTKVNSKNLEIFQGALNELLAAERRNNDFSQTGLGTTKRILQKKYPPHVDKWFATIESQDGLPVMVSNPPSE